MTTSQQTASDNRLQRYFAQIDKRGLWTSSKSLRYSFERLFERVPLAGKSLLDIGAGTGLASVYAAAAGAKRVVALEPEAAGSSSGMIDTAAELAEAAQVDEVERKALTFQAYDAGGEVFDVVLLHNSINHLDEQACIHLRDDPKARQTYVGLGRRLAELIRPGGWLIIADATCSNLYPALGMRNPLQPSIEWHKHQAPETWAALLSEVGFADPYIRWSSFNRFGRAGRLLLGNKLAAYFLMGHFMLTMRRK
jgi:2-polyprenyl-3-methyl-5-hydroxy-6-metoxy-1,4-benzoquinol methylase